MRRLGAGMWGAVVCGLLWLGGVASAQAQTRYHCRDEGGNTYVLSRPCPQGMRTTAAAAGPAPSYSSSSSSSWRSGSSHSSSSLRLPPETPDYHQYLSARCRALDDRLRGSTRNLRPDVAEGLRREYQRDCRQEEQAARSRLSDERRSHDKQRREDEKAAQLAARASQEQQQRHAEQCAESRRILTAKRARTDLTDGEKNDLQRFENAFLERCGRR